MFDMIMINENHNEEVNSVSDKLLNKVLYFKQDINPLA